MKKEKLKTIFRIFMILFSLYFIVLILKDFNFNKLNQLSLTAISVIIAIRIIDYYYYSLISKIFIYAFNEKISITKVILMNSSIYLTKYFSPLNISLPLRIFLMKKIVNIPYTKGTAIIFSNLVLSYFTSTVLGIIALLYFSINIFSLVNTIRILSILILIGSIFFISLIILIIKGGYKPIINKITTNLKNLKRYLSNIKTHIIIIVFFMKIFGFFINAIMMKILIMDLNETINILPLFLIQTIPLLIGALSMLPLGIGVEEVSLIFLLTQLNITPETALTTAIANRIIHTGFSSIIGVISTSYLMSKGVLDKPN